MFLDKNSDLTTIIFSHKLLLLIHLAEPPNTQFKHNYINILNSYEIHLVSRSSVILSMYRHGSRRVSAADVTVQHFNGSCKRVAGIRPDTSFVLHTMTSGPRGSPYGTPKRKEAAAMQRQIMTFRISELEAEKLQAQAERSALPGPHISGCVWQTNPS